MAIVRNDRLHRKSGTISRAAGPVVERIERRVLLSAVLGADGTLTVTGTGSADSILVDVESSSSSSGVVSGTVSATVNGSKSTFNAALVKHIHVNALGGNDTVTETGMF